MGEMAIFWRQLATMVNAGLPIIEVFESISQEQEDPRLKMVLEEMIASMWEGSNLSQSMSRHPQAFSPMMVALIASAEESGSLPFIANQLAGHLENHDRLVRKVWAALTYPIFVCGFFAVVLLVATFWIIPKFREIYDSFDAKLPWITETVFAINEFILSNFFWFLLLSVSAAVAFVLWAKGPRGRALIDRFVLNVPVFGKLIRQAAVARFCRSLAVLLAGGIAINRAMEMAEGTTGNRVMAESIRLAREEILGGAKIAASLRQQPVFPRMAVRMIASGEETGNLTVFLEKTAEFYEVRVDTTLSTINTLIEPVIIILIGGFVAVFVLALYMPIFSLAAKAH